MTQGTKLQEEKVKKYKSYLKQKRDFYSGTDEDWQTAKARSYNDALKIFEDVFEGSN